MSTDFLESLAWIADGEPRTARFTAAERAWLRSVPDDHPVNCAMEFDDNPGSLYAATADGLRELAREIGGAVGGWNNPDYVESQVRHEQAHAEVARAAEFTKIRYGLYVGRTPLGFCWQMTAQTVAPASPVSKLVRAALYAAPEELSADDLAAIQDMGYRDAADVHSRLERAGLGHLIYEEQR